MRRLGGRRSAVGVAALAIAALVAARAAGAGERPGPASLDGVWSNFSATPLERAPEFSALTTTDGQARAFAASHQLQNSLPADTVGGQDTEWYQPGAPMMRIAGRARTSIITDPADGRLPWSDAGKDLLQASFRNRVTLFDNPETRPAPERCLMGGWGDAGTPLLPGPETGGFRIVQAPGFVAIWAETGRDPRIVRLGSRQHLPPSIRPWMGDSIGRWEGRTLVVETTNLPLGEAFKSPRALYISPDAVVTERFTRTSPTEILYAFTVVDPKAFTQSWSGEEVFHPSGGPLYEYACHEGNYALPNILRGARQAERAGK